MDNLSNKVVATKGALMAALGDNAPKYLANMKLWFRHKWTKKEFDIESRKFLRPETIHLHNAFLLAILNKIDTFQMPSPTVQTSVSQLSNTSSNSSRRKRKRSVRSYVERLGFEPFDILDFLPEDTLECIKPAGADASNVQNMRYCVQELFLPDAGFMLGRFLIGAWEAGLVNVEDNVAEYVAMAVQVFLKNLISTIIVKRRHYKVTGEGGFYFDVGANLADPSVRNTVTRQKIDDGPLDLDKEIAAHNFMRRSNDEGTFLSACEELTQEKSILITLKDVQKAFNNRNLIASHSVYSINMERLTQMMH